MKMPQYVVIFFLRLVKVFVRRWRRIDALTTYYRSFNSAYDILDWGHPSSQNVDQNDILSEQFRKQSH